MRAGHPDFQSQAGLAERFGLASQPPRFRGSAFQFWFWRSQGMNSTPEASLLRSKRFPITELNELWRLRGLARSPQSIGRVLGRPSRSVYAVIVRAGEIEPAPRKRSERHLSPDEREEISRRLAGRESIRSIARALQRSPSTICREIARNEGRFRYRAAYADRRAWQRRGSRRSRPRGGWTTRTRSSRTTIPSAAGSSRLGWAASTRCRATPAGVSPRSSSAISPPRSSWRSRGTRPKRPSERGAPPPEGPEHQARDRGHPTSSRPA